MPDERQRAVDLGYRAISSRDRTVAEVRAFLERKRVEPELIDHACGELERAGYLDDGRYAERFAQDKRTIDGWGADRIERDLRRRGVAAEHVERAVAAQGREDELGAAVELLARRFPAPPADERERDRAWRTLVRKGYEPELAYEAVRTHERGEAA